MRRAYRYRLYPTRRQVEALEAQLVFCCHLYNAALEQRKDAWRLGRKSLSYVDQCRDLTEIRHGDAFPKDMATAMQRSALRRVDRAFTAFFRRCQARERPRYPRFRSTHRYDSLICGYKQGAYIQGSRLSVMGVGHIKVKWHRTIPPAATLKTVTVRRSCGKWYVSLSIEVAQPDPIATDRPAVGVDLGVATFAALSTGELFNGPRAGNAMRRRVRRHQRMVARRRQHSHRRRKVLMALAKAKVREANVRRDHRAKLVHGLTRRFSLIAVEHLPVMNMTRSARGTVENPGKRVRQKAGLNRAQLDQAWGSFLLTLQSKAEEAGSVIVKVDPRYTSQTCSECGIRDPASRRTRSSFVCIACGRADHADVNAARNILRLGRSLQALTVGPEPEPLPEKPPMRSRHTRPKGATTPRRSRANPDRTKPYLQSVGLGS